MKIIDNSIIESFVNCKFKGFLKLKNKMETKTGYELMQEECLDFYKDQFIKNIKLRYGEKQLVSDFKFECSFYNRDKTFAISPEIKTERYNISFDFVEIIPAKSPKQRKSFIPILISPKENFSKIEKLILCMKILVLSKCYNINCSFGRIIYGNELKTIKFKTEPLLMESKRLFDNLNKMIKDEHKPIIVQTNHCKICEFQHNCYEELQKEDSLALFRRVDENEIRKYSKKGIFTVKQLSYTFKPRKKSKRVKTNMNPYYLSLHALAIRENKVYVYDEVNLPESKTKVYIDMEGNNTGSFIYLIGIIVIENDQEKKYSFWADNVEQETEIFRKFISVLQELEDPQIYYYGRYESKVFRRINTIFNDDILKKIFDERSINILKEIYRKVYFPTYSNGLKEIAKFFGCNWTSISNAVDSVVWRNRWDKNKDAKIKEMLTNYNYEDCVALKRVTEFLYEIAIRTSTEKQTEKMENVGFVDNMKPADDDKKIFRDMEYATKDVEVITKCAYFEYQRNKIYWRSNDNIRKIIKRKRSQKQLNIKINQKIYIEPNNCQYCKSKNISPIEEKLYRITIFDLKIYNYGIKKWIIQYLTHRYICGDCRYKKGFIPKKFLKIDYFSRKSNVTRDYIRQNQEGWGHDLFAWIIHQYLVNRTTFRKIESNLRYYFKIPMENRKIWEIKILAADYYRQTYENILKKLVNGNLIHADESKVKLSKSHGYIWVFTNMEEVFYLYKTNREAEFLDEFLNDFNGVLVTDFYTGYDSIECQKQKCLVHLIRDLNDILLKNLQDDEVKEIVNNFGKILREIVETTDRFGLKRRFLKKHKKPVMRFFKQLKKQRMHSEVAEKIQKRLLRYENELFTFLDYDNIPWNNNNVEYAIKTCKNHLRIMKGSITERGLEAHLILLTIYQTCKYKGINFLDFLLSKEKDIDEFERSL